MFKTTKNKYLLKKIIVQKIFIISICLSNCIKINKNTDLYMNYKEFFIYKNIILINKIGSITVTLSS